MTKSASSKSIVLYADDDNDDIDLVKDAFSRYSNNVELITFSNGLEALSFLKDQNLSLLSPCLIILDINMPMLDGKQVLKEIKSMQPLEKTPVILFSTSSHPSDKAFAAHYNAGFITKPLSNHQMELVIKQFIDHCTEDVRKKISKPIQ